MKKSESHSSSLVHEDMLERSLDTVLPENAKRDRSVANVRMLWACRRLLARCAVIGLLASAVIAFLIPKQFVSTARLMPSDQNSSGAAMLAALTGKVGDSVGSLSNLLPGMKTNGQMFIGMLTSRTVQDDLVRKFDLRSRYRVSRWEDARKILAEKTSISEDRKSGILTLQVNDRDPQRAATMAQEYIAALNRVVVELNTSSAHRERVFLDERLAQVKQSLDAAEHDFSEFASKNKTIDMKEQGRAMVEAGATLEGELIATQTELQGLRQIYADSNVRVRAAQARVNELRRQIDKLGGGNGPEYASTSGSSGEPSYPSLRTLPLLGVTFADLYRNMRIQEAVFETLTKQHELAKVEEAKELPSVRILDEPEIPEKKSFPPRTLFMVLGTLLGIALGTAWIFARKAWENWDNQDPRRVLIAEASRGLLTRIKAVSSNGHGRILDWHKNSTGQQPAGTNGSRGVPKGWDEKRNAGEVESSSGSDESCI